MGNFRVLSRVLSARPCRFTSGPRPRAGPLRHVGQGWRRRLIQGGAPLRPLAFEAQSWLEAIWKSKMEQQQLGTGRNGDFEGIFHHFSQGNEVESQGFRHERRVFSPFDPMASRYASSPEVSELLKCFRFQPDLAPQQSVAWGLGGALSHLYVYEAVRLRPRPTHENRL